MVSGPYVAGCERADVTLERSAYGRGTFGTEKKRMTRAVTRRMRC
jgi:hypothetical protein